jgi:hypothetical protein
LSKKAYKDFTKRFGLLIKKHPALITMTLSNIFTMRLIGNKTHGDLAEIAIPEFINQYMDGFSSRHVGKDLFRAKSKEEDILVTNESTKEEIPISLKAYGHGDLQLSTDKEFKIFSLLEKQSKNHNDSIDDSQIIANLFDNPDFSCSFNEINVMSLIYEEKNNEQHRCNILVFDAELAKNSTVSIKKISVGSGRKHPVYRFFDKDNQYICEVRYGGANANALQRGLWTNTKKAFPYFNSVIDDWIPYSYNYVLVHLLSQALISSEQVHENIALTNIKQDILRLKQENGIRG